MKILFGDLEFKMVIVRRVGIVYWWFGFDRISYLCFVIG